MSKAVAEEMAIIPGMEEVVSLLHINKQANEGHFDRVIVDAAPTGETIRLLTVPESFQWYVGRLRGWGDAPMRMAMNVVSRFLPDKDILGGLDSLVVGVKELQKVLTDPSDHQLSRRAESGEDGAQGRRTRRHLPVALWLSGGCGGGEPHSARH